MAWHILFVSCVLCFASLLGSQRENIQQQTSTSFVQEGSEEDSINRLIQAQEQSAKKLKDLLQYLGQFRSQEEACLRDPGNLDELYKLSDYALQVKKAIKECYVEPYFRQNFLDDLDKLAATAEKRTPPPLSNT